MHTALKCHKTQVESWDCSSHSLYHISLYTALIACCLHSSFPSSFLLLFSPSSFLPTPLSFSQVMRTKKRQQINKCRLYSNNSTYLLPPLMSLKRSGLGGTLLGLLFIRGALDFLIRFDIYVYICVFVCVCVCVCMCLLKKYECSV